MLEMQLSGRALYDLAHPGLDMIEKAGISTSGSAVPQSGEKPKTDWEIPQTKKLKTLKSYLCDLGRTSNGLYCAACCHTCLAEVTEQEFKFLNAVADYLKLMEVKP